MGQFDSEPLRRVAEVSGVESYDGIGLSDVEAESGQLILSKDQVISKTQLVKLRNIGRIHGIKELVRVLKNIAAKE